VLRCRYTIRSGREQNAFDMVTGARSWCSSS
jgi:hypothetical protein